MHMASTNTKHDILCRAEIALLIAALANANNIAGCNVNEMFIRYNAHSILIQMLRGNFETENASSGSITQKDVSPSLCMQQNLTFNVCKRAQENAIDALSRLAEDYMRCVPPLIEAGTLPAIISLISRFDHPTDPVSIPILHCALKTISAMASYPSEVYHRLILEAKATEHLLRIGCSFKLEMLKSKQVALGSKSLGEIARDTMRCLSEYRNASK